LPVLTATIGVASYPIDGADAADLISAATEALKRGQSFGPNGVAASSDHDPVHASARGLVGRRES
jgi:GGDEF domain-containing protein